MQVNEPDFTSFITIKLGLSKGSIRQCLSRMRVMNTWFVDKDLNKENVEHFFLSLKNKGLKNNTLNTYIFFFRHLTSYYKDRGLPSDFFDNFKSFKKTKSDPIILTLEEIDEIINKKLTYGMFRGKDCNFLDFRFRTLIMFLAYTGCRFGEAAALTVEHIDISAGKATFVNTKSNENRTVYFAEPLKSKLSELIKGRKSKDRVFRNSRETTIQVTDFSVDLKKRAKTAGIIKKVNPHLFRHSYITHMIEAGVPITTLANLTGHKDIQTIYDTYMHLADKTLQKAAMKHPMVRKNVDTDEIIRELKEVVENFHLEKDNRFTFALSQSGNKLSFEIMAK